MRYRVKPGYRFGRLKQFGPGDIVELSEAEANGFLDKLEPVSEPDDPAPAVTPTPDAWEFDELSKHMRIVKLLIDAGYTTPDAVRMASDDELLAVKGIGRKALVALRVVLGAG